MTKNLRVLLYIALVLSLSLNGLLLKNNTKYKQLYKTSSNELRQKEDDLDASLLKISNLETQYEKGKETLKSSNTELDKSKSIINDYKQKNEDLQSKVALLENDLVKYRNYYHDDIRDTYLVMGDNQMLDLHAGPNYLVNTYICKVSTTTDVDREWITLSFDGLEVEYMVVKGLENPLTFMIGYRITNANFKNSKGITVGVTKDDVLGAYLDFYSIDEDEIISYFNNSEKGHTFIFEGDTVKEITFGTYGYK